MTVVKSSETTVNGPADSTPVPGTFTSLLRRRALDLFVIAWVAAVGMTTGRQLVDWWREDPAVAPQPVRDTGEDWYRRPVEFSIGQRGVPLYRSPFVGTQADVERQLMQLVQTRLKDAPVPEIPADEAERSMLEQLKTQLPIATDHGQGTLYRWPAPWPGVVGTVFFKDMERIIAHGFAVPSGNEKWTVFVLSSPTAGRPTDSRPVLPRGAIPLLSWTDEAGRQVNTFRGTGALTEWVSFWNAAHGHQSRTVHDVTETAATLQFRTAESVTDIQMLRADDGKLTGIVWTIPLSAGDTLQSLPTDPVFAAERSPKETP